MSFWTGFLSGTNDALTSARADAAAQREAALQRDQKILTTLIDSDDPEISNAAAMGLININDAKYKPGKGLAKFLGTGVQANPDVVALTQLLRQVGAPTTQPEVERSQADTATSRPGAAAMAPPPSTGAGPRVSQLGSPGSGGEPPPMADAGPAAAASATPAGVGPLVGAPPPSPAQLAAQIRPGTSRQPPRIGSTTTRIFPSQAEKTLAQAKAKAQGDVEGQVAGLVAAGFPDAEARELVRQEMIGRATAASGFQSIAGETPNGTAVYGVLDRATGQYLDPVTRQPIPGFRPRTTTGSTSMGANREAAARELGYASAAAAGLAGPAAMAAVNTRAAQLQAEAAGQTATARGAANATIPLSTAQRFASTTALQEDWRKVDAKAKTMREQATVIDTALSRFQADPPGASEAFRTAYITMFDPNATVREGDYVRLGLGRSVADRIEGWFQGVLQGGGTIPYDTMVQMAETARQVAQQAQVWNVDEAARIDATARAYGIDPGLIRGSVGTAPPAAPAATASPAARVGTPPPAPTATTPASTASTGAAAAAAQQATPPGAPRVGTFVGNEYTGQTGRSADGRRWGRDPNTGAVIELIERNGKLYVK